MIIKGGSRSGPGQLAMHLQRRDTNERVEILELQSPTHSLDEALRDWQILSEGTRGTKGLYHANIDPAMDYVMTPEQWKRAVEILEHELGFDGQPRAVVMHEKHGRQHMHVVWARTDIDTMTLRTDGMNYPAHERASLRLEIEFGHEIVPGKHAKRDRQKQPEFPRSEITHAEWQQGERTGVKREDLKEYITALKEASDNAQSFKAALDEHGYILAKGDKRTFVIVDQDGDVRSLSRQLGMKPAPFQAFMKIIDLDNLPTVAQAAEMQQHLKPLPEPSPEKAEPEKQEAAPQSQEAAPGLSEEEIRKLQEAIATRQAREAADIRLRQQTEIERTSKIFDSDMAEKLSNLDARQEAERARFHRENAPELTGIDLLIDKFQRWWDPKQAQEREAALQRRQKEMEDRQKRERDECASLLKRTNDLEIENLGERHAQQRRDQDHRNEEEIERRIREEETARRLLAEIEEREKLRQQERTRDGPDRPPPLTR